MTAAVCLYLTLGLPEPWRPLRSSEPLIVYGASSAVGSFALQLAKLSNIHPIIAVAGRATEQVEKLIDRSKGDTICDYRKGAVSLTGEMQEAIKSAGHTSVKYALDCISDQSKGTYQNILRVLDPQGQICLIQNYDPKEMPSSVTHTRATVRWVHQDINTYAGLSSGPDEVHSLKDGVVGCRDFAYVMYSFFGRALAKGFLKGHPYKVMIGGLGGVQEALNNLKLEQASGVKYVFQIADTPGL